MSSGNASTEDMIGVLKEIIDPEIPFNIVDLGLVYDVQNLDGRVELKMTLTTPGCGMGPYMVQQAQDKLGALKGVTSVDVEIVWDPPWNPERISNEVKQQLGIE